MPTGSILVADDQPHVVEALRLLLKPEGFAIDTADAPAAIFDAIQHHTYDVVLMDLNYARDTTAGWEGLDLIGRIRQTDTLTPIIVMTAWSTVALAVAAMQRGACDFVQKPWDNYRVVNIVRTQAELGRAARRAALLELKQQQDLELASRVQRHLLPHQSPEFATLDCSAQCTQAGVLGGDYFDFIRVDDDCTAIAVGDVSGKGVAAALLMTSLQALLRSRAAAAARDVRQLLLETNRRLFGTIPANKYATLFYSVYSESERSFTYVNAGHNPPIVVRRHGGVERLGAGGPVLGLFQDVEFSADEVCLRPGDRLALYTDGVTDALDYQGDEFGEDRVIEALVRADGNSASILHAVLEAQATFIGAAPPADDMTFLVACGR